MSAEMGAGSFGTICSGLTISCISEVSGQLHICIMSYLVLLKSSVNSFTSGATGEDSTSSTLLRKVWGEEEWTVWGWCFACVCVTLLQDLCEIVGGVVRNGLVGQLRQEAQHRLRVLGGEDLPRLAGDPRRTHLCGSLEKHHMIQHTKLRVRGPPAPE